MCVCFFLGGVYSYQKQQLRRVILYDLGEGVFFFWGGGVAESKTPKI